MANVKINSKITAEFSLVITEVEARALAAMVGYDPVAVLDVFYKQVGSHYLKPHEAGFYSLFESLKGLDSQLASWNKVQALAKEAKLNN